MIKVNFDMGNFVANTLASLQALGQPEFAPRAAAAAVLPEMKNRIFVEGKRADGSQIGTYKNSYLRTREKNKRGTDTKVILSLTRQLENDLSVINEGDGYAIGFKNPEKAEIAVHLEEKYQAHIFTGLTPKEEEIALNAAILEMRKLIE